MNVLHAGIFEDHELGGDLIFEKGLLQNNCSVSRFDYRTIGNQCGNQQMLSQAIENASGMDLLFIGKGERFNKKTLMEVRKKGVAVALWYGDIRPRPEPWLMEILPEIDFFFMSSAGEVLQEYFDVGKPKIAAYYFNPSDPELAQKYTASPRCKQNLVFTGTYHNFMGSERRQTVDYLKMRNDVIFFGGAECAIRNKSIFERIKNRLSNNKIQPSSWIRGHEYISAIKSASIGIGVNAFHDIPRYTSDRLTHYLMFGTFFLSWEFPEANLLFNLDKELVCFKNIEDLNEKISYFLKNSEGREKIALAGQKKVLELYNSKNMVAMMLDVMQKGNSDRFEWVKVIS